MHRLRLFVKKNILYIFMLFVSHIFTVLQSNYAKEVFPLYAYSDRLFVYTAFLLLSIISIICFMTMQYLAIYVILSLFICEYVFEKISKIIIHI